MQGESGRRRGEYGGNPGERERAASSVRPRGAALPLMGRLSAAREVTFSAAARADEDGQPSPPHDPHLAVPRPRGVGEL